MDAQQCRLYIQWCQSERVLLLVGGLTGPNERFLIPREFLRRRSPKFRDSLERQARVSLSEVIKLSDTLVKTMEDVFVWTFSPQPQIDKRATFSEVVQLGIFAWQYQISALSNQATDMIRENLANGTWQLQASMVDEVYEAVPTGNPLREVIRAALGGLPRSVVEGEGRVREEWKVTFLKHAQLGWDYYEAGGSGWTSEDYLLDSCRFHDHQGVFHQGELLVSGNQCPYAREECFPSWKDEEEESMEGRKDEMCLKGWRATVEEREGEQERCGADEERKEVELSIEALANEAEEPVAMEAVVNGVATEAVADEAQEPTMTEAVVNGVATEAVVDEAQEPTVTEAVVNGVATEAVADEAQEPMAKEAVANGVATEAITEEAYEPVATEAAADEVEQPVARKAVVNGVATEAEINGMATETLSTTTEERADENVGGKATAESKTETAEKNVTKKKKKKRPSKSGQTLVME